jgi:hypothetical protein
LIPSDVEAERIVLGACMESHEAYRAATETLSAADWYHPAHELVWAAITALTLQGVHPDVVLVGNLLRDRGELSRVGGAPYLHTLFASAPLGGLTIEHHAQIIADCATRRRVRAAGQAMIQRAEEGIGDAVELVEDSLTAVRGARDERKGVEILTRGWEKFLHDVPETRRMVVPGLLGEGDRCVLTGSGGLGKSTMLQQIAVCAAAGISPFDWSTEDPFEPVRVTIMDHENPDHRLKTRLWPLVKQARDMGLDIEDRLTLGGRGNSIDLLRAADALSLLRTVEHDKPDLLYIGPVYKMHSGDPDKEMVVKQVTNVLDSIREMGVAVITEAHHTKGAKQGGSLEPSGSNLWTWWPEFGLGLRLDSDSNDEVRRCTLERWRIDREALDWPVTVERGGAWPWARGAMFQPKVGPARPMTSETDW